MSAPIAIPKIASEYILPDDVILFYELCGGMELFKNGDYLIEIVPLERFKRSNPIIIGELPCIHNNGMPVGFISESWYIIAHDFNGDYLTIDLGPERLGKCYDSFHELYSEILQLQVTLLPIYWKV